MAWTAQTILTLMAGPLAEVGCVDVDMLEYHTGIRRKLITTACAVLVNRELIERIKPGCYALTDTGREFIAAGGEVKSGGQGERAARRHTGTLREKSWRAVRQRRKFSLNDLIVLVADGDERDIESNLGKYVRALERAGYLARMPRKEPGVAPTSNGHLRYILVRDTGPLAPVWRQSANTVYDPNIEQETPLCG